MFGDCKHKRTRYSTFANEMICNDCGEGLGGGVIVQSKTLAELAAHKEVMEAEIQKAVQRFVDATGILPKHLNWDYNVVHDEGMKNPVYAVNKVKADISI